MNDNQDFERTRDFLRTKLGDYLRQKGINVQKPFRCLNPAHEDKHPSMAYFPTGNNVFCFACRASYDIFSLIGLDHNTDSFKEQFEIACRMFLSTPQRPRRFISADANPRFTMQPRSPADPHAAASKGEEKLRAANDELQVIRPNTQGAARFGSAQKSPLYQNYAVNGIASANPPKKNEEPRNYHDYLVSCAQNAFKTDYFQKRGISTEVVKRFGLGFDPDHPAGAESWEVAVIPYDDYSYMVRNIHSTSSEDRIKKRGLAGIFNLKAVDKPGRIFITEGEFDALSLETLGYSAISLGGASNLAKLVNYLKEHPLEGRSFCLLPDNDEAGRNSSQNLGRELAAMGIPFNTINLTAPYKDANEALCRDRELLAYRLEHLDEILASKFVKPEQDKNPPHLITDANSLLTLNISCGLHSLCGRPPALRRTLSFILDTGVTNIMFAGSMEDWKSSCRLANRDLSSLTEGEERYARAEGLILDEGKDLIRQLEMGLSALNMQYNERFVPVISLTGLNKDEGRRILKALSTLCTKLKVPMLLLCPASFAEYCEALCMQNLNAAVDERGDLIFEGLSAQAARISFRLSIRDF